MRFEWDDAKDRSNRKKHGLSFTEATQLFEGNRNYHRIIGARLATRREQERYHAYKEQRNE